MNDYERLVNQRFGYRVSGNSIEQYYKSILSQGETPSDLARKYNIGLDSLISANLYNISTAGEKVSDVIKRCNKENKPLDEGTMLNLPDIVAGGSAVNESTNRYYGTVDSAYRTGSRSRESSRIYGSGWSSLAPKYASRGDLKDAGSFTILANGNRTGLSFLLPVVPEEFSDSNNITYNSVSLLGRTVAYQIYNYSGRSCSFSLKLHEDLYDDPGYIHEVVRTIESACYPKYGSGGEVAPPEVIVKIGNQFYIRGVLSSDVQVQWLPPMVDGYYNNCSLQLNITETLGPYSMSQVSKMGGYREK